MFSTELEMRFVRHQEQLQAVMDLLARPQDMRGLLCAEHLAVADELDRGADIYEEGARGVESELLTSALTGTATLCRARARSHRQAAADPQLIRDASQPII